MSGLYTVDSESNSGYALAIHHVFLDNVVYTTEPEIDVFIWREIMKKLSKVSVVVGLLLAFSGKEAFSEWHYSSGNMIHVSSIPEGFIFQMDQPGPDNCAGSTHYFIRAENKVMIAQAMTKWAQKDLWITVYTNGRGKDEWAWTCELSQFQPW